MWFLGVLQILLILAGFLMTVYVILGGVLAEGRYERDSLSGAAGVMFFIWFLYAALRGIMYLCGV